ncbi:peptidoglycan DD-metalloendopeptidase family protein [Candidatus Peregrinibacteria bacterium]|nr:peptidoglycan DD-metalloendopeptidase family protein [Candidatus Peregrinibacteria bacterium]
MQKKVLLFLALLLPINTLAHPILMSDQVKLGQTLTIETPVYDLESAEVKYDDNLHPLYKITRLPKHDEPISRAEFLQLIFKSDEFADEKPESVPDYSDIDESHSFYDEIVLATQLEIVSGYHDGSFKPYETVTRGQAAKILINAFNPDPKNDDQPAFEDVPTGHRFEDHIKKAVQAEIFKGYPDGLMRPDRPINVREAEIVVQRAIDQSKAIFLGERDYFRGYIGIHRLDRPGEKPLEIIVKKEGVEEKIADKIDVQAQNFKTVWFQMEPSASKLFGKEYMDKTWELIDEALASTNDKQLWDGPFMVPTDGQITLEFGDKLYINGSYAGSHFGIDYANSTGTPVNASNSGIIALSSDTPSYGNVIVIDHGQNIFTMYIHLHELIAEKGQTVTKGQQIATMGSTGISTGPHLHFTHFIGNTIVDSEYWFNLSD